MADNIRLSAAIVTYNSGDKSAAAVASVLAYCKQYPLDLYIIDNDSSDDTLLRLKEHTDIKIIKLKKNIGFGAAHNRVTQLLESDYHFIINPDITVHSDVFADIVRFMEENPDAVMAAPKILNANGSEQHLPKAAPTFKRLFLGRLSKKVRDEYTMADKKTDKPFPVDFLSGCFFCIRTEAFRSLGGFDERYFMYLEDADLTARAKIIGEAFFLPEVSVTHLWARESAKNIKLFFIHLISCFKYLLKWRHGAK